MVRKINGILLINKGKGHSSNQVLQKIKRLYLAKKAGHTGSLDPLATGMLPICFGEATKFSHFLLEANKTYITTAKLGVATNTGDAEGEIIAKQIIPKLTKENLEITFQKFIGEIEQIPPMYSALKYQGQALYKLARQGIDVERKKRKVKIFSLELLSFTEGSCTIKVHCSKGTYIRTLVEDIAKALGTVGYVQTLHRVNVVPFLIEKMHTIEEIEEIKNLFEKDQLLLPLDAGLIELPKIFLSDFQVLSLQHGKAVPDINLVPQLYYRLYTEKEKFMGIGVVTTENSLISKRLIQF